MITRNIIIVNKSKVYKYTNKIDFLIVFTKKPFVFSITSYYSKNYVKTCSDEQNAGIENEIYSLWDKKQTQVHRKASLKQNV